MRQIKMGNRKRIGKPSINNNFCDRASQTQFRENEAQTIPWRPDFIALDYGEPEAVEIDSELKLVSSQFDQHHVNIVKRFRKRKEWEKYLSKLSLPENTELQKTIVKELEQEKWDFRKKEIDEINEIRLELAQKELEEQRAIIQERMQYRMNNARNRLEELKKNNAEKYQVKLEREIRRTNFKLEKLNRYPQKKILLNKIYNPPPRNLYQPKMYHEVLCPEAVPSSLNDAYMMLEGNLLSCKAFKKDYPKRHDCSIPQLYEIPEKDRGIEILENLQVLSSETVNADKLKEKKMKNSKTLIATLISGRAVQSSFYRDAIVNLPALNMKYNYGKYLYQRGIEESEKFQESVAAGIRDYNLTLIMKGKTSDFIRHLEGRTISNVLDFTSKEFLRLQEYRKLLILADIAERERWTLEAKEGGRRQEEIQRLRQHEEMYKEVMKTHEISSDAILEAILDDEIEKTGSGIALMWTRIVADHYKEIFDGSNKEEPYQKLEYVARLADRCLLSQSDNVTLKMQQERNLHFNRKLSECILKDISSSLQKSTRQESSASDENEPTDISNTLIDIKIDDYKGINKPRKMTEKGIKTDGKLFKERKVISNQVHSDDVYEVNLDDLANKLIQQVISKAENCIRKYEENLKKYECSMFTLQKIHTKSFNIAYQTLLEELLKMNGGILEEDVKCNVKPWVNSTFAEADKRASNILSFPSSLKDSNLEFRTKMRSKKKIKTLQIEEVNAKYELDTEGLAENIVNQITLKAEILVEQYHKNLQKFQCSTNSLQSIYAESLSTAYHTMAEELLKISCTKSQDSIIEKLHPWVSSVINEAVKRTSRLLGVMNIGKPNRIDMDASKETLYNVDYFYDCLENNEEKVKEEGKFYDGEIEKSFLINEKEVSNIDMVFDYLNPSTKIVYSRILKEEQSENATPEENYWQI